MGPRGIKEVKEAKARMGQLDRASTHLLLRIQVHGLVKEYAGQSVIREAALVNTTEAALTIIVRNEYPKQGRRRGCEPSNIIEIESRLKIAAARVAVAVKEATREKEKEKSSPERAIQQGKAKARRAKEKARSLAGRKVLKARGKAKARKDPRAVPVEARAVVQEPIWTSKPRKTMPIPKESVCRGIRPDSVTVEKEVVTMLITRKGSSLRGIRCSLCSRLLRTLVGLWDSPWLCGRTEVSKPRKPLGIRLAVW